LCPGRARTPVAPFAFTIFYNRRPAPLYFRLYSKYALFLSRRRSQGRIVKYQWSVPSIKTI
jgi:hypothetical protein